MTTYQDGVIFGCDIARFGADETVVAIRQGPRVLALESWNAFDLMATTGRIIHLASQYNNLERLNVDEVGLGGGVVDRLHEQGWPVQGVNVGDAPNNREKYVNLRAELFDRLALRFRDGDIEIPPDDMLISQLAGIRYEFDSRGRMKIESKDEARKRGVRSPDRAEAVMLAFAPLEVPEPEGYVTYDAGRKIGDDY